MVHLNCPLSRHTQLYVLYLILFDVDVLERGQVELTRLLLDKMAREQT